MMIKAPQDFWAGLVFLGAGLVVIVTAWGYPMGTAGRMSYGYFPMLIGGALCVVGLAIILRSFMISGAQAPQIALRPLLALASVVAFGILLRPAGLIVATFALIAISVIASERFRLLDILVLSLVMIPFNWIVFVWALGLPLPLLPWG